MPVRVKGAAGMLYQAVAVTAVDAVDLFDQIQVWQVRAVDGEIIAPLEPGAFVDSETRSAGIRCW